MLYNFPTRFIKFFFIKRYSLQISYHPHWAFRHHYRQYFNFSAICETGFLLTEEGFCETWSQQRQKQITSFKRLNNFGRPYSLRWNILVSQKTIKLKIIKIFFDPSGCSFDV